MPFNVNYRKEFFSLSHSRPRYTEAWTIETAGVVNESLIICSAETYVTSYLFTLSPVHEVMGSKPQRLLKSGEMAFRLFLIDCT